jgi:peptidase E
MKLVLASQGFWTSEIVSAVEELVGKPASEINVAVINEAFVAIRPNHDERWLINELSKMEKVIGGRINFINLRAYDVSEVERRAEDADLIYIVGGKQFILPKLFRETGFDKLLKKFAETKVIMGTSAGAMLMGKSFNQNYWQTKYNHIPESDETQYGWVDFNIIPHFGRPDHADFNSEYLTPLLASEPFPVYATTDEQAVVFDNGKITFVGGEPKAIFGNGEKAQLSSNGLKKGTEGTE